MNRLLVLLMFFWGSSFAQKNDILKNIEKFQEALNQKFLSEDTTPLPADELKNFKKHEFFKINTMYSIEATFIRTPYETPFIMQTTTNREPIYVKYGEAHFSIGSKEFKLNIYQNQELMKQEEYLNYLFLPFTDLTNGTETYSGGRFIDLKIPEKDTIMIDFNTAYNPYCVYNKKYSCPIPPIENDLKIAIPVGIKKYKK